jgi:hypothetical protein
MKVIERIFTNSDECGAKYTKVMEWFTTHYADKTSSSDYTGFGFRPRSVFPTESWVTDDVWQALNKCYFALNNRSCNADSITIRNGNGWWLTMTATVNRLFVGEFELIVDIADEHMALQCKLATS